MTLAQRVRDQRYARGWGPDELAIRAAISRTALYQIESGKTEQPRASTLRRIAQALEIPTEILLGPQIGLLGMTWSSPHPRPLDGPAPATEPAMPAAGSDTVPIRSDRDLDRKFRELLASPLGESVARIVEESYRILPRLAVEARW